MRNGKKKGRLIKGNLRDVAQFGSAPVLGTGGRRFESCHPYPTLFSQKREKNENGEANGIRSATRKTSLVQLVERRFPKPVVVGSSPTGRVIRMFRK